MFGLPPLIEIALIALGVSILYQVVYEFTTDRNKLTELKNRMKNIRQELKNIKPDSKAFSKKQSQMLDINFKIMRSTLKPTMFMMIPFWLIFFVIRTFYADTGVLIPVPSFLAFIPFFGNGMGWLLTYLIFSMVFTQILRKVFDKVMEARL